jgi:hypothetical protein
MAMASTALQRALFNDDFMAVSLVTRCARNQVVNVVPEIYFDREEEI